MLSTLHGYILRELLKTFGLATLALTGLVTMAGALYNVIRQEAITATDIFFILPYLLPGAIAVALPVAALFAGTFVYGRLAADNELTACRAAGINVTRLFLAIGVLGLFVTVATTLLANFVMPDFLKRIERYVRANIGQFAFQQFHTRGYIYHDRKKPREYLITCEKVERVAPDALVRHGFERPEPGLSYFWIDWPRMLEQNSESVKQFATARGGLVMCDSRGDSVKLAVKLANAQSMDIGHRTIEFGEQTFMIDLTVQVPMKPWLVDLVTLLRWRLTPWEGSEIERPANDFLRQLRVDRVAEAMVEQFSRGEPVVLDSDSGGPHTISVAHAAIEDRKLVLTDVKVDVIGVRDRKSRFEAPKAVLGVQSPSSVALEEPADAPPDGRPPSLVLRMQETAQRGIVEITGASRQETRQPHKEKTFDSLVIPTAIRAAADALTIDSLLTGDRKVAMSDALRPQYADLLKRADQFKRKVNGTMHVRLSLSACALVIAVMGALLGVRSRGSHVLSAFFLSCVPAGAVILLICITGYSMALRATTADLGIGVIWGSLAALALVDLILLRFAVQR